MAGFTLGSIGRGLAAAAFALAAAAAQAQDKVTLTTTWFAQAEHGGFYQAVATGIYKKYGLDVTVRMGGPQVNGVQLLLAGQSDFVINYDFAVLSGVERGFPLVTVAAPSNAYGSFSTASALNEKTESAGRRRAPKPRVFAPK